MNRLALITLGITLSVHVGMADNMAHWPQWRGPTGHGVAHGSNPPVTWDENTHIRWKTVIPGRGASTPVVWGDLIFVTTAIETDKALDPETLKKIEESFPDWLKKEGRRPQKVSEFVVLAINRADGAIKWRTTVCEEPPHAGTHPDGTWASHSPVTDGQHVYAYFGSHGLYCLDFQGNVTWQRRFGFMQTRNSFGEGASPLLYGDTLVVPWDHEKDSFVIALDKRTGADKWKVDRDEQTAWATPVAVPFGGKTQVVTSATKRIRSYDLATGQLLWECGGMTGNVVPTPVLMGDILIAMSGFRGASALAIKLSEATGDITDKPSAFVWKHAKDTPYVPSPLLVGQRLYFLKVNEGALSCLNAATGEIYYTGQKLDGIKRIYSSPVAGGERVYVTGTEGITHVIKNSPAFELLATNRLDDSFSASGVIVGTDLILRGRNRLYCIAETK